MAAHDRDTPIEESPSTATVFRTVEKTAMRITAKPRWREDRREEERIRRAMAADSNRPPTGGFLLGAVGCRDVRLPLIRFRGDAIPVARWEWFFLPIMFPFAMALLVLLYARTVLLLIRRGGAPPAAAPMNPLPHNNPDTSNLPNAHRS
jgi:hypothetical protein